MPLAAIGRRNAPHHLIDVAEPDETWTVAQFQQMARAAVAEQFTEVNTPM